MNSSAQFPDEASDDGRFIRQQDAFRDWISADGHTGFPAVAGRYHLYVSLACPWAHRTIIMRSLQRLENAIGMTVVDPIRDDRGWAFRDGAGNSHDPVNGFVDFYPMPIRTEIDSLNNVIYETVNDGVYRAGFATTQRAYESAARKVFETLDTLESRLAGRRYLFGATPVETDWRLFVTLVRFDAVYYGHFKCNLRRILDYRNLYAYLCDLYQYRDVAKTVNFDHIKRHYYMTHEEINPTRIVPIGPLQDLGAPHGRERLGAR
jgi:putative glutathione S-transferase